jgi:hypothetical protein
MIKNFLLIMLIGACSMLAADDVRVLFTKTIPLFVFEDNNGISVDIATESLKKRRHTVMPIYANIASGIEMFNLEPVDANSLAQDSVDDKAYYSDNYIKYQI